MVAMLEESETILKEDPGDGNQLTYIKVKGDKQDAGLDRLHVLQGNI